jgi:inner membrane protein
VQRRLVPGLAFGGFLGVLYGALYALLSGSMLLFAMLSLAMWFTRNLHRPQAA